MKKSVFFAIPTVLLAAACSHQTEPKSLAAGASCSTLTGADETLSAIYEPGSVYRAEPLKERIFRARAAQPERVMGAELSVRAQPKMNAPYMQRVLACHAASGKPSGQGDPLHPSSGRLADLKVEPTKFGYKIQIKGESPSVGEEIWSRAETMKEARPSVRVEQVGTSSARTGAF